jgi:transposase
VFKKGALPYTRPAGANGEIEDPLFNDHEASSVIESEKPWHRQAIEYAIQGLDIDEIASLMGRSRGTVSLLLKQPWARDRITKRAKQTTMEQFKQWLEAEALPALEIIKKNAHQSADLKVSNSAAMYLVDRFAGKAVQPIQTGPEVDPSTLTTDEILQRLAANGALSPGANPTTDDPKVVPGVAQTRAPDAGD